ncbi:MAG: TatA/E family twin arginine-targeting protein translocase [Candidatus Saccharicenans sp.]|jgi:TatA/E family protein of Tat protein translocase|nr:TatA/E family twin arginine-targeting protein translocase [Candidatus Saccharicenans sp.]MDH7575872.1 TatA/E family twin arginine-targeting protein translocase [Candidatus Saccharicenans sp.]NPV83490.1 TatA/E family twin arginine-targeting protein translocase [Candidatus Aminicenantes bacterium]
MFGSIGVPELIVIFIIALLVFGPKKLPEVGKSVGRAIREFKKASDELRSKVEEEINASEIKSEINEVKSNLTEFKDDLNQFQDNIKKDLKADEPGEGQKVT